MADAVVEVAADGSFDAGAGDAGAALAPSLYSWLPTESEG